MNDIWAKEKWAQKFGKEGRGRKRFKRTRLKKLDEQQMKRKIREERKR